MSGVGVRVSIPNSVKKTIQDLKEITGNHGDDEIYAMLKECGMDPNETVQKLLLQDPFHEVKRKRDKRKEVREYKREPAEPRWRPAMQGKGSRGGRGNFSPRHIPHDAGGGKNSGAGIENGPAHVVEKDVAPSLPTSREIKTKEKGLVKSSVAAIVGGPTNVASGTATTTAVPAWQSPMGTSREISSLLVGDHSGSMSSVNAKKVPKSAFENEDVHDQAAPSSNSSSVLPNLASTLGGYFSSSDSVLVPCNDLRVPGSGGTIKRKVVSHHPPAALEGSSLSQGKTTSKTEGVGKPQPSDLSHPSTSTHGGSVSQPPSNSSQPQQLIGTQKVGTNKEWKPKPIVPAVTKDQVTASPAASEVPTDLVEIPSQLQPVTGVFNSEEAISKQQKKLEELHLPQLPQRKLVIPNHIHAPESQRNKFSFGSFGATFGVANSYVNGPLSERSSTPQSETSQPIEEFMEEQSSSNQHVSTTVDASDFSDHPQSPTPIVENLSNAESDASSRAAQGHNESKPDTVMTSGNHQLPVANNTPNYSYGIAPPIFGSPLGAFENSESQARDISRLQSFVVQQAFDPASYYAQFYRSAADSDGRLSPFSSSGVSAKYNGNVGVLPPTTQSPQEGGVLSSGGSTPLVTQAPGSQQPVPVFRPPAGMHISHYPGYLHPYGPYFNPFYMPPPIHQYLGNGAFPQQPQAGGVYPIPTAATAAAGIKYSLPQYKAGTNTGNSNHMGMTSGYGPYGSSPAGYNPSPATTAGNTTVNEDLSSSQFKDNNVYITGHQGQHVFTPTQAGHGTYAGLYHPAQAVSAAAVHPLMQQSQTMAGAVDMVGPGGNVYQQPQHAQQMNWPSNY